MQRNRIEVHPTSGGAGAEIHGIDLSRGVDDAELALLRQALADHGVIFFREQELTPEQHIAFAQRFGKININRFFKPTDTYPEIAEVRKEAGQKTNIGGRWHTDHSYDEIPALGSILLARDVPPCGGDTMFASMSKAFDALSDGMKRTLKGLRAVHSTSRTFGMEVKKYIEAGDSRIGNLDHTPITAVHPVVIRHPDNGRDTLYVNRDFTLHFEGWTEEESAPLLDFLFQHGAQPEFQTRFRWRPGSIAFWDNRATWHLAVNDYHGEKRLMHRITVEGCPLSAAA